MKKWMVGGGSCLMRMRMERRKTRRWCLGLRLKREGREVSPPNNFKPVVRKAPSKG